MKLHFNSIRFKISVIYVAILGAILLLFSAALYSNLTYILFQGMDEVLTKEDIIKLLRGRLVFILAVIGIVLAGTMFLGRYFVAKAFKPLTQISDTARAITHEDLSRRLPIFRGDQEIVELTQAFNGMIERLEKSFKHIMEFTSNVSHEVKTPLAVIRGEADLALRRERSPEQYRKLIKGILEEVERTVKVADNILLLAKLEYKVGFLSFEKINLISFMRDIVEKGKILCREKKIALESTIPNEVMDVKGDKSQLRRLVFNLLGNAIKFNRENGKIGLKLHRRNSHIAISVSDTGKGIPAEEKKKIFERFYRSESSATDDVPGSGLGLSIVKSIAEAHGGTIEVESQPFQGSTFTLTLPST